MSTAVEKAQQASAAVRVAEAVVAAERSKRAAIVREGQEIDEKLSRLVPAEEADAATRIVDGDEAAPAKLKRVSQINNLRERRPHIAAALTLQDRRISDAQAAVSPLTTPLARASLELAAEVQGNAISDIRDALTALSEPAARLIAAD